MDITSCSSPIHVLYVELIRSKCRKLPNNSRYSEISRRSECVEIYKGLPSIRVDFNVDIYIPTVKTGRLVWQMPYHAMVAWPVQSVGHQTCDL